MDYNSGEKTSGLAMTHMAGAILSAGVVLVTFIILIYLVSTFIQEGKTLNYSEIDAKIVSKKNELLYRVSYELESKHFEVDVKASSGYNVGDLLPIRVNPNNLGEAIFKGKSDGIDLKVGVLLIVIFVFIAGIMSLKVHLNNFLCFVYPDKFKYKNQKGGIL